MNSERDRLGDFLINLIYWKPAKDIGERSRRRVTVHLIPILFMLYILAYLDRANVSVAMLGMQEPPEKGGLGFSDKIVGFGAGIFFWGYCLLEIPSTLITVKYGARWVFFRILILWGICATVVGFIGMPVMNSFFAWFPKLPETFGSTAIFINGLRDNPEYQFYFFRFLLGFFEGGFFPSVIVYLSLWYPARQRGKSIATFMSAIPISLAFGMLASGLLLNITWFDLPGWRWVFILEGIAPIFASVLVLFALPSRPRDARWMPDDEREWLENQLSHESSQITSHSLRSIAKPETIGLIVMFTAFYFCMNVGSYGISMFLPAIIKAQSQWEKGAASILASLPYIPALIFMLLNGWHSDRSHERPFHVAIPLSICSVGLAIAAWSGNHWLGAISMTLIVGSVLYAHLPAFWPMPTMILGTSAAATAVGFINMIGNLGGYFGPTFVGKAKEGNVDFSAALWKLAPWPLMAALIILALAAVRQLNSKAPTPNNEE
jgi:MFS transporter, ACS family, tartrate transporter